MDIKVSTKDDKGTKVEATLQYDMPATLAEKVKKFGEDSVNNFAEGGYVIGFQNTARRLMVPTVDKSGKVTREAVTGTALQTTMASWMPDTKSVVRLSKFERASQALEGMTVEERNALLKKVQESLKAQASGVTKQA